MNEWEGMRMGKEEKSRENRKIEILLNGKSISHTSVLWLVCITWFSRIMNLKQKASYTLYVE